MQNQIKKSDLKIINMSEIARRVGYTPAYVHMLLNKKRKNMLAYNKVMKAINYNFKAA
jgi:DNA-binding MarR family transcriptional regulator